jgi:hypothetical protein
MNNPLVYIFIYFVRTKIKLREKKNKSELLPVLLKSQPSRFKVSFSYPTQFQNSEILLNYLL